MSSCKCGCGDDHSKHPSIKAPNAQDSEFGLNQTDNAGVMIRPDRVKEIQLEETGAVKLIMADENGNPIEELNIDFEAAEAAEAWILKHFREYLDD